MRLLPETITLLTLDISPDQLAAAVDRGEVEAVEIHGEIRFSLHSIRNYLASHPRKATKPEPMRGG